MTRPKTHSIPLENMVVDVAMEKGSLDIFGPNKCKLKILFQEIVKDYNEQNPTYEISYKRVIDAYLKFWEKTRDGVIKMNETIEKNKSYKK